MTSQTASQTVEISASPAQVWAALTEPEQIREYVFGADVETSWEPGAPITWRGEYEGERFEDRGEILEYEPEQRLVFTHYSALSGKPDSPESYARVEWTLTDEGERTRVTLAQANVTGHEGVEKVERDWASVLEALKRHVERGRP